MTNVQYHLQQYDLTCPFSGVLRCDVPNAAFKPTYKWAICQNSVEFCDLLSSLSPPLCCRGFHSYNIVTSFRDAVFFIAAVVLEL